MKKRNVRTTSLKTSIYTYSDCMDGSDSVWRISRRSRKVAWLAKRTWNQKFTSVIIVVFAFGSWNLRYLMWKFANAVQKYFWHSQTSSKNNFLFSHWYLCPNCVKGDVIHSTESKQSHTLQSDTVTNVNQGNRSFTRNAWLGEGSFSWIKKINMIDIIGLEWLDL